MCTAAANRLSQLAKQLPQCCPPSESASQGWRPLRYSKVGTAGQHGWAALCKLTVNECQAAAGVCYMDTHTNITCAARQAKRILRRQCLCLVDADAKCGP